MTTSVRRSATGIDEHDVGPALGHVGEGVNRPMVSRLRIPGTLVEALVLYVLCISTALVLSALLVEVTGGSAGDVFSALLDGSLRRPGRIGTTIGTAIPLLLVACGVVVSSRAGLVNIGQEGQLLIGAACGAYVGTKIDGPGPLMLVALLVTGAVGGALWASIAAGLKYLRNVPEVLTTLLFVTLAMQLVGYGLKKQWLLLAPPEGRANRQQISKQLTSDMRIPRVTWFGNEFPISAIAAVAIAIVLGLVLARTVWGFRLRMLGQNPRTARRVGVSSSGYGSAALLIDGAFAGLAGAVMLAGGDFGNYTLVPGFSSNIGWAGLLVALVAGRRAGVAILIAFVFASLRTGSGFLAATGVERRITDVIQGLLVLALLVPPALLFLRQRRRALAATKERT